MWFADQSLNLDFIPVYHLGSVLYSQRHTQFIHTPVNTINAHIYTFVNINKPSGYSSLANPCSKTYLPSSVLLNINMERGESSRAAYRRGLEAEKVFLRFEDIESEETWERVTERPKKGAKKQPETKSEIYGYQSAGFESVLRRGWLAERRKMEHGRIYMVCTSITLS